MNFEHKSIKSGEKAWCLTNTYSHKIGAERTKCNDSWNNSQPIGMTWPKQLLMKAKEDMRDSFEK